MILITIIGAMNHPNPLAFGSLKLSLFSPSLPVRGKLSLLCLAGISTD